MKFASSVLAAHHERQPQTGGQSEESDGDEEDRIIPKSEWGFDANAAVRFHLIWEVGDDFERLLAQPPTSLTEISSESIETFNPELSHQIFGPDEEIFGYHLPRVDVFFSPGNCTPLVVFKYDAARPVTEDAQAAAAEFQKTRLQTAKAAVAVETEETEEGSGSDDDNDDNNNNGADEKAADAADTGPADSLRGPFDQSGFPVANDDVMHMLTRQPVVFERSSCTRPVFGSNVLTDSRKFADAVSAGHDFVPPGVLADRWQTEKDGVFRSFEVYKSSFGDPACVRFHENIQTFPLWFIDAASFLDVTDDKWSVFYLFETRAMHGKTVRMFGGFVSLYAFFAWPDKVRLSISQFLILPHLQNAGNGERLLRAVYRHAQAGEQTFMDAQWQVRDVVVETPVLDFTRLRDKTDLRVIEEAGFWVRLPSGKSSASGDSITDPALIVWNSRVVDQIQRRLKLSVTQLRRCYEVAKLSKIKQNDAATAAVLEQEVKQRIMRQHQEALREMDPTTQQFFIARQYQLTMEYYAKLLAF